MKLNFMFVYLAVCCAVVSLLSCESHEQKADDAFENVKTEKMLMKDSVSALKDANIENSQTATIKKDQNFDSWNKFKSETEKKIVANEIKIKAIKGIPNANAKLLRQVTSLEKDNNDLRRQMDQYNEDVKLMWENFKIKINHDVNEIGIELKDLSVNNK